MSSAVSSATPVLEVESLSVSYGSTPVVADVSFHLRAGEKLAIVGESGSGKSTLTSAVLGLLPAKARVAGSIMLAGEQVLGATEKSMRALRGRVVAYVPQDPMSNLDPVLRVGWQVEEAGGAHPSRGTGTPRSRAIAAMKRAGLSDADERFRSFPHELSGGMRQRALIAMGMINAPRVLIADEPTSALDVTVQRIILDNLDELVAESGTAVLLVTHDLGLAAERADRVLVMHQGRLVEEGRSRDVLVAPQATYTRALVAAAPATRAGSNSPEADDSRPVALALSHLSKVYPARGHGRRRTPPIHALDDVSLTIRRGQTLAVVGESGSGKSTAAKIALKLLAPTSGRVEFESTDVTALQGRELRTFRRKVQPIFQDPYSSLDPMFSVEQIIEEPLRAFGLGDVRRRRARARELLDLVRLPASILDSAPSELSGGQRQRVAIARALAPEPEVIVCDEPVSALDVLVQANVLDVLRQIQGELGVAYLFISHDLGVVEQIAHEVAVMAGGRVVERGSTRDVFARPQAPYTRQLLDAVPGRALLKERQSADDRCSSVS